PVWSSWFHSRGWPYRRWRSTSIGIGRGDLRHCCMAGLFSSHQDAQRRLLVLDLCPGGGLLTFVNKLSRATRSVTSVAHQRTCLMRKAMSSANAGGENRCEPVSCLNRSPFGIGPDLVSTHSAE